MPENDISKMKVADLKRELKLRGLQTTGNKTELQERLQTALIDGDLSLEDTAISGEDLLEDVLTDEEDKALILPPDENELLKSPSSDVVISFSPTDKALEVPVPQPQPQPKKIVLKRKSSITPITMETTAADVKSDPAPNDENGSETKISKIDAKPKIVKVSALTLEERLQMRAKKFGIEENKVVSSNTNSIGGSIPITVAGKEVDAKQIETLKKRAERFGCVVAPAIAEITANERLEKRKQRFGDVSGDSDKKSTAQGKDVYAEKARQRLERFKTAAK
ncbi:SAP domain-containing ribonucleoprotein [Eupeodes corollae]|uniref:SAP domain-containing ribonucleoprotein n=1 Tax=Eupeodes corollae TaxID=290404 RepID=UPI0024918064|nr:SAP domain-containing ribonucleoprotein [Eupeodes corollae]